MMLETLLIMVSSISFFTAVLFHLDKPVECLGTLAKIIKRLLTLKNHFASEIENETFKLGVIMQIESFDGR